MYLCVCVLSGNGIFGGTISSICRIDVGSVVWLMCSFFSSSILLIANADLDVVNYEITCVRKRYNANIKFAKYTRRGKAKNMKS